MEKVVLAYSGGLDTSVICHWLSNNGYEVIAWAGNVGQREDWKAIRKKAIRSGAIKFVVDDLRDKFVTEYVYPSIQMNARYEGRYYLGTSLARPCLAYGIINETLFERARYIAHGATGKGNDQVRFELSVAALAPQIKVIAPWRMDSFIEKFKGREDLIKYAKKHNIPIKATSNKPWSSDENLMHISFEAGMLENPAQCPRNDMFELSKSPKEASDKSEKITITFEYGNAVAINGKKLKPVNILKRLNELGGKHGIGRIDMVESRFVGMKSRGVYETPGGAILMAAHRDLEGLTMDKDLIQLKEMLMPRFATLVYNGYWFSREMDSLMAFLEESQVYVNGKVTIEIYKGNIIICGRESKKCSLYNKNIASMEDDAGAYDQKDATGFIKLHSLPLIANAKRNKYL